MSKLLSMFGIKKDDEENIPEMILHKNDPEPYYDKELKTWMIPGQEEEIKKNLMAQKKPPPIGKSNKPEAKNEEDEINSLVNPRKPKTMLKKQTKNPKNRYANIMPNTCEEKVENTEADISESGNKVEEQDKPLTKEKEKEKEKENNFEFINKNDINESPKRINDLNYNLINPASSFPENIAKENNSNNLYNTPSTIPNNFKRYENIELIKSSELQYQATEDKNKINEEKDRAFINEINELKDILEIYKSKEENYLSDITYLKENQNEIYSELIKEKILNQNLKDELSIKEKNIENLNSIVISYQKELEEQSTLFTNLNNINSIEESFTEKINFSNEEEIKSLEQLFQLRKDLANITIEKNFFEIQFKEIEKNSKILIENLTEKNNSLDKSLYEANKKLEKFSNRQMDLEKKLENFSEVKKKLNEKNNLLIEANKISQNLSKEIMSYRKTISDKEEKITILDKENAKNAKMIINNDNEIKKLNNLNKEYLDKINELNLKRKNMIENNKEKNNLLEKIHNLESFLKSKNDEEGRINNFIEGVFDEENEINISEVDCDDGFNTLESRICLLITYLKNIYLNKKQDLLLYENENKSLKEDNESLRNSMNILNKQNINLIKLDKNNKTLIKLFKGKESEFLEKQMKMEIDLNRKSLHIKDLEEDIEKSKENENKIISNKQNEIIYEEKLLSSQKELENYKSEISKNLQIIENMQNALSKREEENNLLNKSLSKREEENNLLNKSLSKREEDNNLLKNSIKEIKESTFKINFEHEKLNSDYQNFKKNVELIVKDLDDFIELKKKKNDSCDFEDIGSLGKMQDLDNILLCKINLMKNICDFYEDNGSLKEKELSKIKEEIDRISKFSDIKEKENLLMLKEIKLLKEKLKKSKDLEEFYKNKIQANDLNIINDFKKKEDALIEEITKLKNLKNNLENYKEKISQLEKINKELSDINANNKNLNANTNNIKEVNDKEYEMINKKEKFISYINMILKEFTEIFIKYEVKDLDKVIKDIENNNPIDIREIKRQDPIYLVIKSLVNDLEAKEKEIISIRNSTMENIANKPNESEEINILISQIDEKNKEINDLKEKNKDLEIQINKTKLSLEETKKNYDNLLINSKSAEKINYYMNKVSQLNEEKGVILSTNSESIRNLTNQITQLNIQLNEYKKKELNDIKPNIKENIEKNNKPEKNPINFEDNIKQNNKENEINQKTPKSDTDIDNKTNPNNTNNPNKKINEKKEKEPKRDEGFLTRFLAPIFLTENERNNLSDK